MPLMKDCPHTLRSGASVVVTAITGIPTCSFCERIALVAEVARLTECLKKANSDTEEFERRWYLMMDERDQWKQRAYDHTCSDDCSNHDEALCLPDPQT